LRGAILRCKLAPDELVIDRLSVEMGLSQIPVRAAIQRLQTEGLVVINPHSSAIVAPLSPTKIDEVFTLLESLERTAFRIVAERHSTANLAPLDLLVDQMDAALAENDSATWLTANIAFHRQIAGLAAMPLLVDFPNRVLDEWERISHFCFQHVTSARPPQAQEEHRQIVSLCALAMPSASTPWPSPTTAPPTRPTSPCSRVSDVNHSQAQNRRLFSRLTAFPYRWYLDYDAFLAHVDRTYAAGLIPAVDMDTGYANLLTPAERLKNLDLCLPPPTDAVHG
jgi:DNA-binding GntR family transcriptional regulator